MQLNPKVLHAEYAVRGALALRAEEIREQLRSSPSSLPFNDVVNLNIGNPQQLGQKPITFIRQVLALVQCPDLIDTFRDEFPRDVVERAESLLKSVGSVGAYSVSNGPLAIRQSIAKFIETRDGVPSNPEDIMVTSGASAAAVRVLRIMASADNAGVLIPIPQYPLYSATLTLEELVPIPYYLNERQGWTIAPEDVESRIEEAKKAGIEPRVLVVINPGNPTGSVLPEAVIEQLIDVAAKHNIVLLADEVYQDNVFDGEFVSFKKVRSKLISRDAKYRDVKLVSIHSTSKGFIGECGQRGGYLEMVGLPQEFRDQMYKLASVELCSVVAGQVLVELMVNPPREGDESYALYAKERDAILAELRHRAYVLHEAFAEMEGVSCQRPMGALYLFPRISLPEKAIAAAKEKGMQPDVFYCMELLNNTGICVVPGSGFGQERGTFHYRTTFLAPGVDKIKSSFVNFHNHFMKTYR